MIFFLGDTEEIITSSNCIRQAQPISLSLPVTSDGIASLLPGEFTDINIILHTHEPGIMTLGSLLTFREVWQTCCVYDDLLTFQKGDQDNFYGAYTKRVFSVQQLLNVSVSSRPSGQTIHEFFVDVEVQNGSSSLDVVLNDYAFISSGWRCKAISELSW